jgi:ferredoxin
VVAIFGELNVRRTLPGYEGRALQEARRLLEKKGYEVFFTDAIGYPFNATSITNTPQFQEIQPLLERGDARVKEMAASIKEGKKSLKPCHVLNEAWSWAFGKLFSLIGRRAMGKLYVADSRCSVCGQCVAACPVGAIRMKQGKPSWTLSCEACQRCINACPAKAIQTSLVRLVVLLGITFIPFDRLIFPKAPFLLGQLFAFALCLASLFAADRLIGWLERRPGIGRFFEFSLTRRFRRYKEPNFKPGMQISPWSKV